MYQLDPIAETTWLAAAIAAFVGSLAAVPVMYARSRLLRRYSIGLLVNTCTVLLLCAALVLSAAIFEKAIYWFPRVVLGQTGFISIDPSVKEKLLIILSVAVSAAVSAWAFADKRKQKED